MMKNTKQWRRGMGWESTRPGKRETTAPQSGRRDEEPTTGKKERSDGAGAQIRGSWKGKRPKHLKEKADSGGEIQGGKKRDSGPLGERGKEIRRKKRPYDRGPVNKLARFYIPQEKKLRGGRENQLRSAVRGKDAGNQESERKLDSSRRNRVGVHFIGTEGKDGKGKEEGEKGMTRPPLTGRPHSEKRPCADIYVMRDVGGLNSKKRAEPDTCSKGGGFDLGQK